MPSILFVCTANICRSPMAGAIFRKLIADLGVENDWTVESAGTWGSDGIMAAEGARAIMKNRGIDLGSHRSRIVSREILGSADLVLTMEKGHKEALTIEYPDMADRIFLLSEMVEKSEDIADPIGGPLTAYERTADQIEHILRMGYNRINSLVNR